MRKKALNSYLVLFIAYLFVCFVLTSIGFSAWNPVFMAILTMLFVVVFVLGVSQKHLQSSNDYIIFTSSLVVKLIYMIYKFGFQNITSPDLTKDAAGFWEVALEYYSGNFSRVYTPFPYVLNFEFHIFGPNIICCIVINIMFSMLMLRSIYAIMNKLNISGNTRLFASILVAFLPYSIILSNSLLREAIYFFLIAVSFEMYIDYVIEGKEIKFYLSLICLLPVLYMHIGYFPIACVFLFDKYKHQKIRTEKQLLVRLVEIIVLIGFILLVVSFDSISYFTGESGGIEGIIEKLEGSSDSEVIESGTSRYLGNWSITSIGTFLLYSPIRFFYYLFSPLPTHWRGISDTAAFLFDSCVHFYAVYCGIRCMQKVNKSKEGRICKVALYATLFSAFVFGLGTSTAGTAMRHRDVMIAFEAIIIGIYLSCKDSSTTITLGSGAK